MIDSSADRQRIVFLDHLRGLACLLVVFGHVYLMGVNDPRTIGVWLPFVQGEIFGPGSSGLNPFSQSSTWLVLKAGITFGGLGVAIFFLISGYIILRTVDRESPGRFLVRRAFRIFPLALAIAAGIALYTSMLAGDASPHSVGSVIATGFAIPGIAGTFSTIPVIWSLTIETFFYIAMAALAASVTRIETRHLAIVSIVLGVLSTVTQLAWVRAALPGKLSGAVVTLGYCCFHTGYLFIGSAIYRAKEAGFSREGIKGVLLVGALFAITLTASISFGDFQSAGSSVQTMVAAIVVFVAAMLHGLRWRGMQWFRFFGDVSYPLYLLHIPTAWAIMFMLARSGVGMNTAVIASIVTCVALSWVLHVTLEMPFHALGRFLTGPQGAFTRADSQTRPTPADR